MPVARHGAEFLSQSQERKIVGGLAASGRYVGRALPGRRSGAEAPVWSGSKVFAADRFTLRLPFRRLQPQSPLGITGVFDEVAIEVRCAIGPPCRTSLTQLHLGGIDTSTSDIQFAASALCIFDSSPSIHEFSDKLMTLLFWKCRIGRAPEPAPDEKVTAVGCCGIGGPICHGGRRPSPRNASRTRAS